MNTTKLTSAVEQYLTDLRRIRASGGATSERSYYPPLINLLNAIGGMLKPKVFCVGELAEQGAGHPDLGLYAARQVKGGKPSKGQSPERGVVEVKPVTDDAWLTASGEQVSKYWSKYRLVLVTNTRDFVLLGADATGMPAKLETFRLAGASEEFELRLEKPRALARELGAGLGEYLCRALAHSASITEPRDLAWLMASYARDGLARVEAAGDAPSLHAVRSALEEALGVRFEGEKGMAFFRSTLVQTLFYGVFSAWVLWSRQAPAPAGPFDWRTSVWHLRAPILRALFQQLSSPAQLQPLGLVELLDWTAAALDRVDRGAFFDRFDAGEAVPYFYEPFLEAFDPELRKQLGVWYTPAEVVRYMVARVDLALKEDLGIADGLAAGNVYVLDPCCGTGTYLAEVLRRIAANLQGKGLGALTGAQVKQAATSRVFGFEIMPAPFVVSHLQVGLTMQALDAPLSADETERAGVYLTNALTGWEPGTQEPLPFPELAEERDRAERVKRETPVLVILGNPPYNGFAGMAVDEERALSTAYRTTKRVRRPEGQGLNDLYVRFFRMAERRIAEKTGQGVICFISNYSWLDGLSFTGMRERFLEAFDTIRIDCLNGDKYKTGKKTPEGDPDPSVFSTPGDPVGIQVGTAIATLVRKSDHELAGEIGFRNLWGTTKLADLTATAEASPGELYDSVDPNLPLGLPLAPTTVNAGWPGWPALPDLFPTSFPGVKTSRDRLLVDLDLDKLKARVKDYFDSPASTRPGPDETGFIRYAYRPFDTRWLYWEANGNLLDRPRPDYKIHVIDENQWMVLQNKARPDLSPPMIISDIGDLNQMNSGIYCVPLFLRDNGFGTEGVRTQRRPNLSDAAQSYLHRLNAKAEDMFYHALAVLHDPIYRQTNADALRAEGPRIHLPGWPEGDAPEAAEELAASAARGRKLAALLDSDTQISGVTTGLLRPEAVAIAVPSIMGGGNMAQNDFALTAGWGHFGQGKAVMPGQGHVVERPYTTNEFAALGKAAQILGESTFDVYLNDRAYWRNLPAAVWSYKLGGYQVLKKWLSYRERAVLGRPMTPAEVQHFTDTARRIAAILLLMESV